MCGIFCEVVYTNTSSTNVYKDDKIKQRIRNRGPDSSDSLQYLVDESMSVYFYGSVLWMQGDELTKQPVVNDSGILLFNGDLFDEIMDSKVQSDTQAIMDNLSKDDISEHIVSELKKLKGPFSLLYMNKLTKCLYFTRDRIGRNTLLIHNTQNSVVISSVLGRTYKCAEIPATCIYKLNLQTKMITQYPWENDYKSLQTFIIEDWLLMLYKKQNQADEDFPIEFGEIENFEIKDEIIDYIDTVSQHHSEKNRLLNEILKNSAILSTVKTISNLLERSVKIRVETQPTKCRNCISQFTKFCSHSATGILFSGGLDCSLLALLADKYVPEYQSIDLLNVAFKTRKNLSYEVPDRLTGRESYEELKKLCPNRSWIFREINVPVQKLEQCQLDVIGDLVYPRRTILDESLGSALWFASLGQDDKGVSPCRVLLVGSGADELFGGYMRHRNALKRCGWSGLSRELLLDWKRISFRNLARDNRVICDHGRQPRMPYLDENFVEYVLNLKPWFRCFPTERLGVGIGDKLMLRLVATYLGLNNAAVLPKRAIQFGSRIANNKQKGSDISNTFKK